MIGLINISKLTSPEYLILISFIWVALFCLLNFYRRGGVSWFFLSILFFLVFLNRFWHFDSLIANWLVTDQPGLLKSIDKTLPFIKIYQNTSVWIMVIIFVLLFVSLIVALKQLIYRRFTFMLGLAGFLIYMIGFFWWLYWILSSYSGVPADVIMTFRQALFGIGNLFFIGSFILALKR